MYPILICSIIALAVILERAACFILTWEDPHALRVLVDDILSLIRKANRTDAPEEVEMEDSPSYRNLLKGKGPFSAMALCFIRRRSDSREELDEAIHNIGRRGMQTLQRRLGTLSAVAHLTPLMGLFGTVLGMIDIFRGVQLSSGAAEVAALSGGIWVALLTTAFGMVVAIPASAAYHFFEGIIGRREEKLQDFVEDLHALFGGVSPTGRSGEETDAPGGPYEAL